MTKNHQKIKCILALKYDDTLLVNIDVQILNIYSNLETKLLIKADKNALATIQHIMKLAKSQCAQNLLLTQDLELYNKLI